MPPATVGEVMNLHPMTVNEDTDLAEAADLMTTTGVKSLPVLNHRRHVVGVVSRRDVIHLLARPDTEIEAELDDLYRRLDRDWLVEVRDGIATVTGPEGEGEHAMAVHPGRVGRRGHRRHRALSRAAMEASAFPAPDRPGAGDRDRRRLGRAAPCRAHLRAAPGTSDGARCPATSWSTARRRSRTTPPRCPHRPRRCGPG